MMLAAEPHGRGGLVRFSWLLTGSAFLQAWHRGAAQEEACPVQLDTEHNFKAVIHTERGRKSGAALLQTVFKQADSGTHDEQRFSEALHSLASDSAKMSPWDYLPDFLTPSTYRDSSYKVTTVQPTEAEALPVKDDNIKDDNEMGPDRSDSSPDEAAASAAHVHDAEPNTLDDDPGPDSAQPATQVAATPETPPCEGVERFGRCWYLSRPGDDCISTCISHGRAFRFGVAGKDLVPMLLGFQPARVAGPWMAFDTYNARDNRSRQHSSCSANDYRDKDGTWSNPAYQLACPCGGVKECYWKQPPACESVFVYNGMRLSGCVKMANRGDPWCQHDHDNEEGWSHCTHVCLDGSTGRVTTAVQAPAPKFTKVPDGPDPMNPNATLQATTPAPLDDDDCVWTLHKDCHPEFDYGPDHLVGCTRVDHHSPWCSKTKVFNGSWAHCTFSCPEVHTQSQAKELKEMNFKANNETSLCTWFVPGTCSYKTTYLGVEYEGCIHADSPGDTPWCSHDAAYKGEWDFCEHKCFKAEADDDDL